MYNLLIGYSLGVVTALVLIRYGIGLGTKIVYRAKENLPIFGKEEEPTTQTHTGDYDGVEENEQR